jgi:hypothetical protein
VIEKAKHQECREQGLPLFAAQPEQERCIEHAKPSGRVACKAQQRRRDEDGDQTA